MRINIPSVDPNRVLLRTHVYLSGSVPNFDGNDTLPAYPFDTAALNQGGAYNLASKLYTAPYAGSLKAWLSAQFNNCSASGPTRFIASFVTSGGQNYIYSRESIAAEYAIDGSWNRNFVGILKLAAGETVDFQSGFRSGTKVISLVGGAVSNSNLYLEFIKD